VVEIDKMKILKILFYCALIIYCLTVLYYLDINIGEKIEEKNYTEKLVGKLNKGRLCCDEDDEKYIQYLENGLILFRKNNDGLQEDSIWLLTQLKHFIIFVVVVFFVLLVSVFRGNLIKRIRGQRGQ